MQSTGSTEAALSGARACLCEGKIADAEKQLSILHFQGQIQATITLGRIYEKQGQKGKTKAFFLYKTAVSNGCSEGVIELSRFLIERATEGCWGDASAAGASVEDIFDKFMNSSADLNKAVQIVTSEMSNKDAARGLLQVAAQATKASLLCMQGVMLLSQGSPKKAEPLLEQASGMGSSAAASILADIYMDQKKTDEAIKLWRWALQHGCNKSAKNLHNWYRKNGQLEEDRLMLEEIRCEGDVFGSRALGSMHLASGDLKSAERFFEEAYRNSSNIDTIAIYNLAWLLMNRGDLTKAQVLFEEGARKGCNKCVHFLDEMNEKMCRIAEKDETTMRELQKNYEEMKRDNPDMFLFKKDDTVILRGLKQRQDLNGKTGRLVQFSEDQAHPEGGRWTVQLDGTDAPTLEVSPSNLEFFQRASISPEVASFIQQCESYRNGGVVLPAAMRQKLEEHSKRGECVICLEEEALFVMKGCGHLVACMSCRLKLVHEQRKKDGHPDRSKGRRKLTAKHLESCQTDCAICRTNGFFEHKDSFQGKVYTCGSEDSAEERDAENADDSLPTLSIRLQQSQSYLEYPSPAF